MATSNKYLKGQEVAVYLEGTKIAESTSCTVSYSMDTEDISTKDDTNLYYDIQKPTVLGWSIQNESYVPSVGDVNTFIAIIADRVQVEVQATDSNGVVNVHGYAYITSFTLEAPVDSYAKISMTLEGTGSDLIDEE